MKSVGGLINLVNLLCVHFYFLLIALVVWEIVSHC
jgi:hypothetical protein